MHAALLLAAAATVGELTWREWELPTGAAADGEFAEHASGWDQAKGRLVVYQNGLLFALHANNATAGWVPVTPATNTTPPARTSSVYGVDDRGAGVPSGLVIAAGENTAKDFFNDVWRFDFATDTWRELTRLDGFSRPEGRYGASGGISGGVLRMTHGFSDVRYSDTWMFDLSARFWKKVDSGTHEYSVSKPHARCLSSGTTASNGDLFLFGGCMSGGKTGGPCPAHDGWCRSVANNEWYRLSGRPTPRARGAMVPFPPAPGVAVMVTTGTVEIGSQWLSGDRAAGAQVAVTHCGKEDGKLGLTGRGWEYFLPKGNGPLRTHDASVAASATAMYVIGGRGSGRRVFVLEWTDTLFLDTPKGSSTDEYFTLPMLHAIFMFLGWGVMSNIGVFAARYLKAAGPVWFKIHKTVMPLGLLFSTVGFGAIIASVSNKHFSFAHGGLGLAVMLLAYLQPLNAVIRPHAVGVGEPKPLVRTVWEIVHKYGGRVALLAANINMVLGLLLIVAPTAALATGCAWIGAFFAAFVVAEGVMISKHGFRWKDAIATKQAAEAKASPDASAPDAHDETAVAALPAAVASEGSD
eukprot:Rhum_TRINITY_DN4364_c0_g1::Rhum_TRINITY_DN4364_c0_g1_i1::g.13851::m.13851